VIDRRELNELVRSIPLDQLPARVESHRGALERRRRQGEDTTQAVALLDHVDELLEYVDQAKNVLAQGVDEYWGPITEMRLSRACDEAEAAGIDVGRFREPVRRLKRALAELEVRFLIDELDDGERPPEEGERMSEIEYHLDRYAAEGIDVSKARAAVERAHYIERCWSHRVDPDSPEADALFDGDDALDRDDDVITDNDDDDDIDDIDPADEDDAVYGVYVYGAHDYDGDAHDYDDRYIERDDDPTDVRGSKDPPAERRASAPAHPKVPSADASPPARPNTSSYDADGRQVIEGFLHRTGIRHGVGVGATTLHAIVRGLLALDRAACVSIAGEQLVLVEHLHNHGMLRAKPCERSARAALRKLVKHTPFAEHISRTRWRYRLDQLWEPTSEFLEAVAAYDAAGQQG